MKKSSKAGRRENVKLQPTESFYVKCSGFKHTHQPTYDKKEPVPVQLKAACMLHLKLQSVCAHYCAHAYLCVCASVEVCFTSESKRHFSNGTYVSFLLISKTAIVTLVS